MTAGSKIVQVDSMLCFKFPRRNQISVELQ
jgi:hypothetical protein